MKKTLMHEKRITFQLQIKPLSQAIACSNNEYVQRRSFVLNSIKNPVRFFD